MIDIAAPYLLFLGDAPDPLAAKVARGVRDWRPEKVVGQMRLPECQADMGVADMTIAAAAAAGARTLIVGVANRGGVVAPSWIAALKEALEAGMDLAAGLHQRLADIPELAAAAAAHGRVIHDVRHPKQAFPVADGLTRPGKRVLTVGTDCSVGKMYASLAIEKAMRARGVDADFRATGQTGILITGGGVSIDAVVADFISGAVETLAPEATPEHWDVIEGQGSLFHPSFAGVSTGLLHGAQADALVLCHEPTRNHMRGLPHYSLPSLEDCIKANLAVGRLTNPDVRFTAVAVNTSALSGRDADRLLSDIETRLRLPTADPMRGDGADTLAEAVLEGGRVTRRLTVSADRWPIRGAFVISRGSRTESATVTAVISEGGVTGRGEGVPYPRYGESVDSVIAEIEAVAGAVAAGATREDVRSVMRPGAARAAVDAALWDLEAKQAGRRAWDLVDQPMAPLTTAYTVSLGSPDSMGAAAAESGKPLLKLKLGGTGDLERVRAVRAGAPNAQLIVDANEAWTVDDYAALTPELSILNVAMIEQPFPASGDHVLRDLPRPISICADESAHDAATIPELIGKYDMVNIKLDKTGGLTEALRTRAAAEAAGLRIMVGCMVGSSLAMAPALVVAQGADIVDLDGPLLLAQDRDPGLRYDGAAVHPPEPALWG